MDGDRLKNRFQELVDWRNDLAKVIEKYNEWLTATGLGSPETELRIYESVEAIKSDKLTVAFVAEFSRGKTELINAIFFADYKRRLLPSTVGRTTMCPTELFFDNETNQAYIRLLPIETRREDTSIIDFKRELDHWTTFPLDTESPDQMAEALQEVIKSKKVSVDEARALGLYDEDLHEDNGKAPTEIEVPVWRHALISFPHPLLKEGLVVLDTPGLNALGTEPELTLSMLPSAQAVVFVLAPDTGVTKSDLEIWQDYIKCNIDTDQHHGVIAALNKIDTLWDEMKQPQEVDAAIDEQCQKTADMLGIKRTSVIPISAQKALVAKTKHDDDLLEKSRILNLEGFLADEVIPQKQNIVGLQIASEIGAMIKANQDALTAKHNKLKTQHDTLVGATGRNADVIKHLTQKTREQQVAYNNNMKHLQSSRRLLATHSATVMNELSLEAFDYLVTKTRKDMTESWTTSGLKKGMKTFFDGINETFQVVVRQMDETLEMVEELYTKFHEEHGLPEMEFPKFSMHEYYSELKALSERADDFRNSTFTTMTEQSFVVKKFFISIVSHTREIFFKAHHDAEVWLKEIMNPLISQINIHKQLLEQHLDTLCKINETKETLGKNVDLLTKQIGLVNLQLKKLQQIDAKLQSMLKDLDTPDTEATSTAESMIEETEPVETREASTAG